MRISQNTRIEDIKFLVLDTETTGLSPKRGAKMCEIAVLESKLENGIICEHQRLINPGVPIPREVSMIHGITDDMVHTAPKFNLIAPWLVSLMDNAVLVGHNISFDMAFLEAELHDCGLKLSDITVLDTLKYCRRHGSFEKNSLGHVAISLGYSSEGWHRALADVKMTAFIFSHFVEKFKKEHNAQTLKHLEILQTKNVLN